MAELVDKGRWQAIKVGCEQVERDAARAIKTAEAYGLRRTAAYLKEALEMSRHEKANRYEEYRSAKRLVTRRVTR